MTLTSNKHTIFLKVGLKKLREIEKTILVVQNHRGNQMQNQEENYILNIEGALNRNPEDGIRQLEDLIARQDALSLVPKIFNVSSNSYMLFGGCKILEEHIKANWSAISEEDRYELRNFVTSSLSNCQDIQVRSRLNSVLVKIAIRSYPDDWPNFLSEAIYNSEFEQFQFFLEEINDSPIDILPQEKKAAIIQELAGNAAEFLQALIQGYQISDKAINRYIRYINWDMVCQVDYDVLFSDDPLTFGPLCSILQIDGAPEDLIHAAFDSLAQLEIDDENTFKSIVPVLQKHIYILENEQHIQSLMDIHTKLLDIEFLDLIYYWEPFVVTIYAQFQKSGGLTPRFNLHYKILSKIREFVIFNMVQPPDFIIPEVMPLTNDQEQREIYNDMRSILISFVGMTPQEVHDSFLEAIHFLKDNYSQDNFLSIIWTLGCISGATTSQLESSFVVESMKFVLETFRKPDVEKSVIASAFLFLASAYSRAQKLTSDFIDVTIRLAVQALDSHKTQKIASNTLLSVARYSTSLINTIPEGLLEIIGGASISPEIFSNVCESFGRMYQTKFKKIDAILEVLIERFNAAASEELNFNTVQEEIITMNGFVGLSRVNPNVLERLVIKYREMFIQITEGFGNEILQICEENGSDSINRDDVRQMMEFIQSEALLFKELKFKDCGDILTLYSQLPTELRFPEALEMAESLYKSDIAIEIVNGLQETVVKPTEEMISNEPGQYPEHEELFPRVLYAIATSYFEIIDSDDIDFLIGMLTNNSRKTVLGSIKALDKCVEKADMKLIEETRVEFFSNYLGVIIYHLLHIITDPNHFYCYSQVLRLLYKLFDLVGTGKVRCDMYPETDNIQGMSIYLCEMTVADFPLLTVQGLMEFVPLLFKENIKSDDFEELIAQYIAKTRQTTQDETLDSIKLQEFKNSMTEGFYF